MAPTSSRIISSATEDGLILHGILSAPERRSDTCIVHIHGMSGSPTYNSFYNAMHEHYPQHGVGLLVGETRGSNTMTGFDRTDGTSAFIGNAFEIFEESVFDVAAWIQCAKAHGFSKIILQGHSLGCSKVAYFLAQRPMPETVQAAILLSPADMLGLVEEPSTIEFHRRMMAEASQLKPDALLSERLWGYALLSARTYKNFFSPGSHAAIFNYFNPKYGFEILNKLRLPVLAFTGTIDDGITPACEPRKAMEILKNALKNSARVESEVFVGAAHDFVGFDRQIVEKTLSFIGGR